MITLPSKRFYVYTLSTPDGIPFYVGKGSNGRVLMHQAEAFATHPICMCGKCQVIRVIWKGGDELQCQIVYETDDEQAAYGYEETLIRRIGSTNLVNVYIGRVRKSTPRLRAQYVAKIPRKPGSIFLRRDGRWCATLCYTLRKGKSVRKWVYGSTREEVEQRLERVVAERDRLRQKALRAQKKL